MAAEPSGGEDGGGCASVATCGTVPRRSGNAGIAAIYLSPERHKAQRRLLFFLLALMESRLEMRRLFFVSRERLRPDGLEQ